MLRNYPTLTPKAGVRMGPPGSFSPITFVDSPDKFFGFYVPPAT
jgi:hypothetical protein